MNVTPRPALRALTPYIPGKSIASVQRELGLKRVIKLASNENPLGPSPKAMAAYKKAAAQCSLYPEGESPELRQAIARFHKLPTDHVIVGNGSDELIRLICEAFIDADDEVIVSQYAFIRFRQQAAMMGARIVEVPAVDWTHDLDTMAKAASPRTKIVFIANPNNPTGTYNTTEELERLLQALPPATLVVHDEAYFQYATPFEDFPQTVPGLLRRYPNLVVLRTFSKAYGLAGLRVGYAAADPELIGWLDRIRMPFNVNLPAQQAAIEALKDQGFVKRCVGVAEDGREELTLDLRDLGLGVVDSATNFLFVKSPIPGRELFKALLRRGVIVRPLEEYGLGNYVRITIGTPAQNKLLLSSIEAVLPARVA